MDASEDVERRDGLRTSTFESDEIRRILMGTKLLIQLRMMLLMLLLMLSSYIGRRERGILDDGKIFWRQPKRRRRREILRSESRTRLTRLISGRLLGGGRGIVEMVYMES